MSSVLEYDVVVIGAGPSGAMAAGLLVQKGYRVLVLEKMTFPRFSIGESLLPQCMGFLEQANMLRPVVEAGFQYKNGAAFQRAERYGAFDFRQKFSEGWGTTYQVERGTFDKILADQAAAMGAEIRYEHEITAVDVSGEKPLLTYLDKDKQQHQVQCQFVLDGSGFGRVLPRLLDLERPSDFPVRKSIFTHVVDHISDPEFDRSKILITVHPEHQDIWIWLIPFSNGKCSLGVVGEVEVIDAMAGDSAQKLQTFVSQCTELQDLLCDAEYPVPVREIVGYSADVKSLVGNNYALLGNAGEFLDPVFSSGVTIALKSSTMAAPLVDRQLQGEDVDWESEFCQPLKKGVETFRTFVEAWYDGRLQDIIFSTNQSPEIRAMISSILAGYAWDEANPYVKDSKRRVNVLAEICRQG
ncbi:MAG: FAD-dependent oxidoreductase [Kangiellaceae bacterium]|jgi:flavin-dependent dehydrogenase|nr:FAD-dependent oxidoreductase [Kangiellaceae bacterium]|tara:strand:+ start:1029 stop:2264 length:1236 start_codon:yes stop_codon:yes gene_type:complete